MRASNCHILLLTFFLILPARVDSCEFLCDQPSCKSSGAGCELDYGVVNKGDIIKGYAILENLSSFPITISQNLPAMGANSPDAPYHMPMELQPHEKELIALQPCNTANFTGPIAKTYSYQVTIGARLRVEMYAKLEAAEEAMKEGDA